jgi:hypothetical protein
MNKSFQIKSAITIKREAEISASLEKIPRARPVLG